MAIPKHNLTVADCDCIDRMMNTAEEKLHLARELQQCGLPTEEFVSFFESAIHQCKQLKQRLFPDRA